MRGLRFWHRLCIRLFLFELLSWSQRLCSFSLALADQSLGSCIVFFRLLAIWLFLFNSKLSHGIFRIVVFVQCSLDLVSVLFGVQEFEELLVWKVFYQRFELLTELVVLWSLSLLWFLHACGRSLRGWRFFELRWLWEWTDFVFADDNRRLLLLLFWLVAFLFIRSQSRSSGIRRPLHRGPSRAFRLFRHLPE